MSDNDFIRLRKQLRYLTVAVILLIVLFASSVVHNYINPTANSFPKVQVVNGKDGQDAEIDYDKVNALIHAQVASLPKPLNGTNGSNGQGIQGIPGVGIAGTNGTDGKGEDGKNGADASPSPVLQVRIDPITCQLQQKYDTSDIWVSFAQLPKPCEVS